MSSKDQVSRRRFLETVVISAGAATLGPGLLASCGSGRTAAEVFPLSVASGDPRQTSVVLWTRAVPADLEPVPLRRRAGINIFNMLEANIMLPYLYTRVSCCSEGDDPLGDHYDIAKSSFYNSAARLPFIVRPPRSNSNSITEIIY